DPLRLPFIAYLLVLGFSAALAAAQRETVVSPSPAKFGATLSIPSGVRAPFVAPAASGFAAMAVVGLYAALGPTIIRRDLHIDNYAVAGLLVAELFVVA